MLRSELHSTFGTPTWRSHSVFTLHSTLFTPLRNLPSTLYTLLCTHFFFLLNMLHPTLHTLTLPSTVTLHCLHFTFHTSHSTLFTQPASLYTPHSTLLTPHFAPWTFCSALYTPHSRFTLHTSHFALDSALCTGLYTLHCTRHFALSTLHSKLWELPTPHSHSGRHTPLSTLCTSTTRFTVWTPLSLPHTPHTSHSTLYTLHFTSHF